MQIPNGLSTEFNTTLSNSFATRCVITSQGLAAGSIEYSHLAESRWTIFGRLGLPDQSIRAGAAWQLAPTQRLVVETDGSQQKKIVSILFFYSYF